MTNITANQYAYRTFHDAAKIGEWLAAWLLSDNAGIFEQFEPAQEGVKMSEFKKAAGGISDFYAAEKWNPTLEEMIIYLQANGYVQVDLYAK